MAIKISELNSSSLPLTGDEIVPLVQGLETKKVTVNDLLSINQVTTQNVFFQESFGQDGSEGDANIMSSENVILSGVTISPKVLSLSADGPDNVANLRLEIVTENYGGNNIINAFVNMEEEQVQISFGTSNTMIVVDLPANPLVEGQLYVDENGFVKVYTPS
jgi:hypothetical protein